MGLGSAFLTSISLPSNTCPLGFSRTVNKELSSSKVINPNPLDPPESRSFMILASTTVPNLEKYSDKAVSSTEAERVPTKSLRLSSLSKAAIVKIKTKSQEKKRKHGSRWDGRSPISI